MSFEADITRIKKLVEEDGRPVFKAASQEEVANRPDPTKEIKVKATIYVPLFKADGAKRTKEEAYEMVVDAITAGADLECQIHGMEIE